MPEKRSENLLESSTPFIQKKAAQTQKATSMTSHMRVVEETRKAGVARHKKAARSG